MTIELNKLPHLAREHVYALLADPTLIDNAKGTTEEITERLIRGCKTDKCTQAMKIAFEWLIATKHIKVSEIKTRIKRTKKLEGRIEIELNVERIKLGWDLPKEKNTKGNVGKCDFCVKTKLVLNGPSNRPICLICLEKLENTLEEEDDSNSAMGH